MNEPAPPIDRSNMYLVDESGIEEKNDSFILASDELKDHLAIINHSLDLISSIPNLIVHTNDDELVVQRLIVRCFNSAASSLRLGRCGYYQTSFAVMRDVVETSFLLDLFDKDRSQIKRWYTLPAKEREKEFKPWKVRKLLDDAEGNKEGLRGAAYKMLSNYAAHPTPEGYTIISPNHMTQVGPFPDLERLTAVLRELARHLSYAGLVIGSNTPKYHEVAFSLNIRFLTFFNEWRMKYMPGTPKFDLIERMREMYLRTPTPPDAD
jgi:hypothetical protein